MSIEKFVEEQISQAMEAGEFDNLAGRGKPLDLETYFRAPEDLRMAYSILKDANFVPAEVELLKEIESLKRQLAGCADAAQRNQIDNAINDKNLSLALLMEKRRRGS